jgi:5'-AMP-activated protein kinase regulatory beta subunit
MVVVGGLLWTTPHSYSNPHPAADDYAKEPPVMPPHLQLTLLNVPPTADTRACLPRPQHVILNHIYLQRGQVRAGCMGFGTPWGVYVLLAGRTTLP